MTMGVAWRGTPEVRPLLHDLYVPRAIVALDVRGNEKRRGTRVNHEQHMQDATC